VQQLLLVIHVLTCVSLAVLVLLQHGKGADVGAAFGSGASNTVFGSHGASSFLFKLTAFFAAVFFATSLVLGYIASVRAKQGGGMRFLTVATEQQVPVASGNEAASKESSKNQE
jgi:preprotein translocase subunit SecG